MFHKCGSSSAWVKSKAQPGLQSFKDRKEQTGSVTIGWNPIGLAWLRVRAIGSSLLHSCGVLRLSVRGHILGGRSRKNVWIGSAIWEQSKRKGRHVFLPKSPYRKICSKTNSLWFCYLIINIWPSCETEKNLAIKQLIYIAKEK